MTRWLVRSYQRIALVISYWAHHLEPWKSRRPKISWVVGPDETASMVIQIGRVIPDSYTVSFVEEVAYGFAYDHHFKTRPGSFGRLLERLIVGPILLGRLMNQSQGFLYMATAGFLLSDLDQREFEFAFLRKKGLVIVCYWCGSDIRSTRRMHELEAETGMPNISTYIGVTNPIFETEEWEKLKERFAVVADRYASAMYSFEADQRSYLTTPTETFLYFIPEPEELDETKFDSPERIVVVHAATSPIIKGTQLVRSAVAKLREEGYDFEYVELIGVSNSRVLSELGRAHIALNQFYGFTPAVFGAEAMMHNCVLLTNSDDKVEPDLPEGSSDSWVVTRYFEVYENLKRMLDNPGQLEQLAGRGRAWAREYASEEGAGRALRGVLDAVLDGSYEFPVPKLPPYAPPRD